MKKQTQLLLLLSMSYLLFSGCTKDGFSVRIPTTFTLTFTSSPKALSFTGYFTASGGVTTSGNTTMDVTPISQDSIHCTQTLFVPGKGNITILSHCSFSHNSGSWHIQKGTGIYSDLRGEGRLVMNSAKEGPIELMRGTTWRQ